MRRIEWLTSCKDRIPEGAALAIKLAAELAAELTLELAGEFAARSGQSLGQSLGQSRRGKANTGGDDDLGQSRKAKAVHTRVVERGLRANASIVFNSDRISFKIVA